MVPVDPTRALYAWEQQTAADQEVAGGSFVPQSVGLVHRHTVPFFTATLYTGTVLHVPLYEPMTPAERLTVDLLRDAHRRRAAVTVQSRTSSFWGVDIATQVELA